MINNSSSVKKNMNNFVMIDQCSKQDFSKNKISKSFSADSFYISKNSSKNRPARTKNSYSFSKKLLRNPYESNKIDHYTSHNQSIGNNEIFELNTFFKNQKSMFEDNKNESNIENSVHLDGLFYNERFDHNKKDSKIPNETPTDYTNQNKINLNKSKSHNNLTNKGNSKILKANNSSIDLNNSIIGQNQEESKFINSTRNNLNGSKDFPRDLTDSKLKQITESLENTFEHSSISPNACGQFDYRKHNLNKDNDEFSNFDTNDREKNYNYRYDLIRERENNLYDNFYDKLKYHQSKIYKAYLKEDFLIEILRVQLRKGQIVEIIFAEESNHNSDEFSHIKYKDCKYESQLDTMSLSKCYLIIDGNHYLIPREYIEIQKF